jgi:hypothetical protein
LGKRVDVVEEQIRTLREELNRRFDQLTVMIKSNIPATGTQTICTRNFIRLLEETDKVFIPAATPFKADGIFPSPPVSFRFEGMEEAPSSPPVPPRSLLTDKRRIHLRSASVRTYTFFTTEFPRFSSIRGARGLQAFDLPLLTNYLNPIYD